MDGGNRGGGARFWAASWLCGAGTPLDGWARVHPVAARRAAVAAMAALALLAAYVEGTAL